MIFFEKNKTMCKFGVYLPVSHLTNYAENLASDKAKVLWAGPVLQIATPC